MKRHAAAVSACALLLMFAARTSQAQVLYTLESANAEAYGHFGLSVAGVGDADADGYQDVAVGAYFENGGANDAGRAYTFSGQTGGLLHTLQSPNPEGAAQFGCAVSGGGDVDNNGYDDIIVGAYEEDAGAVNAGRAYVFEGQTGGLLHTLQSPSPEANGLFGVSVSGAGDVDSDDHDDVIVGTWSEDGGASDAGRVYVFGGQTGGLLRTLQSPNPESNGFFGFSVSRAGDTNNDGCEDIVVGAYQENGGDPNAGRAYVFSGDTGTLLHALQSPNPEPDGNFGVSVSRAGDTSNDGYGDVIVGAWSEDGGAPDAGRAYIFSGQTGTLLHVLQSPNPELDGYFGYSVSGAGDQDNDGCDDVVVGAYWEDGGASAAGRAYIFSGQTGGLLWTLQSPSPKAGGAFGVSVSGAGDVNNAGYDDLVVGAYSEDGGPPLSGRAYVFAPSDVPVELATFRGEPQARAVSLIWVTLAEKDNLGFNLGRAPTEGGPFDRLNESVIRGAGTTSTPHTYSYLDETVEPGTVYWYRLEDVSLSGDRTFHGPIEVFVTGPTELGLEVLGSRDPSFLLSFGAPGRASLDLYDVSGRRVASIWEGDMPSASTTTIRLEAYRAIAPGLCTAVLSQNGATVSRKVAIVR